MDPYNNQGGTRRNNNNPLQDGSSGGPGTNEEGTPENPNRNVPDGGQPTGREPQYSGGFTVIPPNQARRTQITSMAQREEQELQRWREANRPAPLQLNPERLGGGGTLAAARDKQLAELRRSKLQKKLKKEDLDRKKRQEEEDELQKMKAVQREKAEKLAEKERQEEQRRRDLHRQDHLRGTEKFLQRFERTAPGPLASNSATHTSSRSEAVESLQVEPRSVRDVQEEHLRVNAAFLDGLEGRGRGREEERPRFTSEESNTAGPELAPTHLDLDPDYSWMQETDQDPEYDWALMKLMKSFPDCCKAFLEDILDQCNGDYDQASALLISTLS
ncbi:epithelial-stromal interaction protein 1 [Notolabrus celidotus]|uniref:epithelial-stromal interaction protein 1 n=1 Tax=Notolabrus celidotus TaxID=1203425 RepID=UPI00148F85E6|nr:epithelial-stromal interaction protein 1 [Notolabrus celidotus]